MSGGPQGSRRPRAGAVEPTFEALQISASKRGSRMKLRVRPGARSAGIEGELGGALKLSVSAAPEKGKANEEVERLIAERLGLARSDVEVVAGHGSRSKLVEIRGLTPGSVRVRLRDAAKLAGAR